MSIEEFLAIDNQGGQLSKETFICILNLACRMVKDDQRGAEFSIGGFCSGIVTVSEAEANPEDASSIGDGFLVSATVEYENAEKVSLSFVLPRQAKYLVPQVESYEEVPERNEQYQNN